MLLEMRGVGLWQVGQGSKKSETEVFFFYFSKRLRCSSFNTLLYCWFLVISFHFLALQNTWNFLPFLVFHVSQKLMESISKVMGLFPKILGLSPFCPNLLISRLFGDS